MELFSPIPTNFAGWIGVLAVIVTGIFFLFSKIRSADMDLLRKSNQDLRDAIEDKGRELETVHKEIGVLKDKVEQLEKRNKTLEDLVVTALKQYFFENPKVANQLKDVIKA